LKSTSVVVRSILFHVAAFAVAVPLLPLAPLLVFDRRVWWPIIDAYLRVLGWLLKVICGVDHRIDGLERLPKAPYLLASRHESAWEVLFFPLFFDDPVAFAKREIFSYPLGGRIARRGGHISIDRSGDLAGIRAAFQGARDTVAAGRSVLIFPSGTRHVEGRDRIQAGVGALYDLLGVPCVPVVLDSGRCWPPDSWLKYPGTIHVRVGEPIAPGIDRAVFPAVLKERLGLAEPGAESRTAAEPARASD
jgi:1-acyl-sn-glycerol-3-phosphate acyltransferase